VISVKFSKISKIFSTAILENFIEHLDIHPDCLIYFVFFYRSYLFCNNIKQVCKEYELFNHLFSFYKKFFKKSYIYELGQKENSVGKNLNNNNKTVNAKEESYINSEDKRFLNNKNNNNNFALNNDNTNNSLAVNRSIIPTNINNINKFINPEANNDLDCINNIIDFEKLLHLNKKSYKIKQRNIEKEKNFKGNNNKIISNIDCFQTPFTFSSQKQTQFISPTFDKKEYIISVDNGEIGNNLNSKGTVSTKSQNNLNKEIYKDEQKNNFEIRKSVPKFINKSRRYFIENFINEKNNVINTVCELSQNKNELSCQTNKLIGVNNRNNINTDCEGSNKDRLFEKKDICQNKITIIPKKLHNKIPKLNFNNKNFLNTRKEINETDMYIKNRIKDQIYISSGNETKYDSFFKSNCLESNNILHDNKNFINNQLNNFNNINLKNIVNSPKIRSCSSTKNKRFTTYHAFKNSIINQNPLNSKSDRKTNPQSSVDHIIKNNYNLSHTSKYTYSNNNNQSNETININSINSINNPNRKSESFSLKKKVPLLNFPLNTYDQHYSLSRSSQRNDFIKSSGSSTTAGLQSQNFRKKIQLQNIPNKKDYLETVSGNSTINLSSSNNEKLFNQKLVSNMKMQRNPIKNLKILAQTLGESCLAADLASLINHKRDMELEKIANEKNKTLTNNKSSSTSIINSKNSHDENNKVNNKNNDSIASHNLNVDNCKLNKIKINMNNFSEVKYSNLSDSKNKKNITRFFIDNKSNDFSINHNKEDLKNIRPSFINKNIKFNNSIIKEEEFIKDKDSLETENIKRTENNFNELIETNENLAKESLIEEEKNNENNNNSFSGEIKKNREIDYLNKLKNSKDMDSDEEYYDNLISINKNNYMIEKNLQIRNILNKQQRFKNNMRDDKDLNNNPSYGNNNRSQYNGNDLSDLKKNFIFSFDYPQGNMNFYDNNDIDKNLYKMRELLINFLLVCLKEYSLEELYMSKMNINLLYSFLHLPSLQYMKRKEETKVF